MKRMTVAAILATAVLAFSLVGCSQAQTMTKDTLKGIWSLDPSSSVGFEAYLDFEDDDVVEMVLADSWLDGTWSVSGTSGTVTFDSSLYYEDEDESSSSSSSSSSESTAKLSYSNNKLTLGSDNGSKLVFVKDDSEKAKEMFSFDLSGLEGLEFDGNNDIQYVDEVIEDIPPVTVADDDKITITVTGKGTDYTGDPCYRMSITNKTDKAVYVIPEDDFKVGDMQIEAGLGDELEAGETIETEMYFAQDDLKGGLEKLTTVDGVIQLLDDKTDDVLGSYTFHME